MATEASAKPDLRDRMLARVDRLDAFYARRGPVFRVGWVVVGVVLSLGGLALLALPGPGLLVVLLGLGMLAPAFPWARGLLRRSITWADRWQDWITATPGRKRLAAVLGLLGLALAAFAGWWLFLR